MIDMDKNKDLLSRYCIRIGDTSLILGQRLGEWCGHGPILEEDIALTNIALDLIGQTRGFYSYACELRQDGKTEDDLAYMRDEREFQNILLAEQPNGDFAMTMFRQLLISAFHRLFFESLSSSQDQTLAALAAKSLKEVTYHFRHSADWTIRLGMGTEESARRIRLAVEELWMFTDDLFDEDQLDKDAQAAGIGVSVSALRDPWNTIVANVLREAGLSVPSSFNSIRGSRSGRHTEQLGHILAEMQSLHRSIPGATW